MSEVPLYAQEGKGGMPHEEGALPCGNRTRAVRARVSGVPKPQTLNPHP